MVAEDTKPTEEEPQVFNKAFVALVMVKMKIPADYNAL